MYSMQQYRWRYRVCGVLMGICGALVCAISMGVELPSDQYHMRWNWATVDTGQERDAIIALLRGKKDFVIGAATAEYQILGAEGLPNSALAHAEEKMERWQNAHHPHSYEYSGIACDGWKKRFEDIELLEEMGMNAYRFSVDWSKIEPQPGVINYEALKHYRDLCRELHRRGMRVMVTLHHFVLPAWFAERGGFEHLENILAFVRFCERVYRFLAEDVDWWCTINEPGVYILQGYMRGVMPPFLSVSGFRHDWAPAERQSYRNISVAARVLKHLLRAHAAVYHLFHRLYKEDGIGGHKPVVGLAHQCLYFESYHGGWDPRGAAEAGVASLINRWVNLSIIEALRTGMFSFWGMPFGSSEELPGVAGSLDFIGLNYYSHVFFDIQRGSSDQPGRYAETIMTDMPYELYAEGMFRAIEDIAKLQVPIYITENGIADRVSTDPAFSGEAGVNRRDIWIKRYLAAIAYAIGMGYDVRGYFYWSLMDNWEWDMGYGPRFGLYHVDFLDSNRPRRLKGNARELQSIARAVTGRPTVDRGSFCAS